MDRLAGRIWSALAALALVGAAAAPAVSALDRKARQETFDAVWERVRDRHYDPTLGGVDWNAVRKRYLPQALDAPTDAAFFGRLNAMLGELKQSHFGVIPPAGAGPVDPEAPAGGTADPGIVVQLVEDRPVITHVEPGSGAEQAGLKPGLEVVSVDGKPLAPVLEKSREADAKARPAEALLHAMMAVGKYLRGPDGSKAEIEVREGDGPSRTVSARRADPQGEVVKFGQLPAVATRIEKRRLADGVGYLRFNIFLLPMLDPLRAAIREMKDAPGIIVDVRGNPGGVGMMAAGLARSFYNRETNLGTMKLRTGELRFPVFPDEEPYLGPLVILTDEASLSTSEILAGGLQENGRAVVVGRQTGGMVLPSQIERLPGGARLQYAIADFKTPKGVLLEGRGVVPDVPVRLTRAELLASGDPVLNKALEVLRERRKMAGQ